MIRYRTAVAVAVAVIVTFIATSRNARVQTPSPFAGANVVHVGLVTRDLDKAVTDYAAFFGVPVPKTLESKGMPWPEGYTGDRSAWARIAFFPLKGTLLDLVSPVGGASPWRNHLDRAGEGLQHLAIEVNDVDAAVADLIKRGGKHEMGALGFPSQYVNMEETLGITFEILKMGVMAAAGFDKAPQPTKFATGEVEHVGVVVRDADKAAKLMADVLGLAAPNSVVRAGLSYPKEFDPKAAPKIAYLATKPVAIEFTEPTGGKSPWRDYLEKSGGPAIHHVGMRVTDLQEKIAYAQKNGAQVVVGPTRGQAIVDLKSHPLPFAFELIEK